jgi:hypothetical protein
MDVIFDEYDMRKLPPRQRLDKIMQVLKTKKMNRYDGIPFGLRGR